MAPAKFDAAEFHTFCTTFNPQTNPVTPIRLVLLNSALCASSDQLVMIDRRRLICEVS
jgi:hypothetical protein